MSMCRVFSCVVGRGCFLWPEHFLGKTVSLCPASFYTPRPNLPVISGVAWLPTLAIQSPIMKRACFFLDVSSRRSWRFIKLFNFSFFCITDGGIDLDYRDFEWFALETNSFIIFDITSKYCISGYFVDYEGYSNSPKRLLPTVVDVMVIWAKFTHSSPF